VARLLTDDPAALGLLDASAATSAAFVDPTDATRRRLPRFVKVGMYHPNTHPNPHPNPHPNS
jgi:hypothetical protein